MLLKPKKNRKKGFTLIELIVVVAILAILAAIAVPSFLNLQAVASRGVDVANASAIVGAINVLNAMGTTNKVADCNPATAAAVKPVVDAGLWPTGFGDSASAAAGRALKRITVASGVATVSNTDTSKDPA